MKNKETQLLYSITATFAFYQRLRNYDASRGMRSLERRFADTSPQERIYLTQTLLAPLAMFEM